MPLPPPSRRYRLPCLNRYCRQLLPPIPPHTPTCRFSISFSNLSASTLCSASRCCAAARGEGSLRTRSSSASTVMLACVHGGAWECMRVHGGHVTGDGSLRIHSIPSSTLISACICMHGWCMGAHGCAPTRGGGAHGCTCSTALLPPLPHLACPGLLGQDGILLQLVVGEHIFLHSLAAGVVTGQEVPEGGGIRSRGEDEATCLPPRPC